MLAAKLLLVLFVLEKCFLEEVAGFQFELSKSTDWQYVGRCVDFTLKATLTASTPLSLKVRAPHVSSVPHMIILGSKVSKESNCTSYTGSSLSNITARTNNAELKDDLKIDLGTVTVTGTCVMYFDFKFQLISHTSFSNGAVIWPGFAVQYKDEAVFALQHGVKTMSSNSPQPTLNVKVEPAQPVFDASQSKMVVRVKVSHDCLRTLAKATSAEVTIDKPPSFTYSKFTKNTGSVDVTKKAVSGLVFQNCTERAKNLSS
ncbi:hypothetical protein AC249_AIPGENE7250 [Exaiptasia diaphana]|nr:hypothetical protein AC249_AIPGENE7250 [Exaiptasia diaphana]